MNQQMDGCIMNLASSAAEVISNYWCIVNYIQVAMLYAMKAGLYHTHKWYTKMTDFCLHRVTVNVIIMTSCATGLFLLRVF